MWIERALMPRLQQAVVPGKVVALLGPRRVGKTELIRRFLADQQNYLFVSGEDIYVREAFSSQSIERLSQAVGSKSLLVLDEAQFVPHIGLNLKLLVDHRPELRILVSGSASFELARQVGEPLTGRKQVLMLYPISQLELGGQNDPLQAEAHLESRLIFGSYPEIFSLSSELDRQEYLLSLVSDQLLKDILAFEGVQKSKKIMDLLILIALQMGQEVSIAELSSQLGISRQTVERYLDLLEQSFIVMNLRALSRNLRKEVTKSSKYYFLDTGIRNAILNNFNPLQRRQDVGALWENYLIAERVKKNSYQRHFGRCFFWRTYDQKEMDWVEERGGALHGFEFKWGKAERPPALWKEAYPDSSFACINRQNYLEFIAGPPSVG